MGEDDGDVDGSSCRVRRMMKMATAVDAG